MPGAPSSSMKESAIDSTALKYGMVFEESIDHVGADYEGNHHIGACSPKKTQNGGLIQLGVSPEETSDITAKERGIYIAC